MIEALDEDLRLPRQRTVSVFVVEPGTAELTKTTSAKPRRARRKTRSFVEWSIVLVAALTVALLVRAFVFGAFYIPSDSMEPVLGVGDRILVNKLSYVSSEPSRGDLIVFLPPETATDIAGIELIKRVVAIGGDTVQFIGGSLFLNGVPTEEEYILPAEPTRDFGRTFVPEDHIFVMGDNRSNSRDSRQFGSVPVDNVVGRALVTYWPPSSAGTL